MSVLNRHYYLVTWYCKYSLTTHKCAEYRGRATKLLVVNRALAIIYSSAEASRSDTLPRGESVRDVTYVGLGR